MESKQSSNPASKCDEPRGQAIRARCARYSFRAGSAKFLTQNSTPAAFNVSSLLDVMIPTVGIPAATADVAPTTESSNATACLRSFFDSIKNNQFSRCSSSPFLLNTNTTSTNNNNNNNIFSKKILKKLLALPAPRAS